MKTLLSILLCAILLSFGCSQQAPTPFRTYTLTIDRTALNFDGTALVKEAQEDTIRARNDTLAFHRALIYYYATVNTLNRFDGRMGTSKGFELTDSTGLDIAYKLDAALIDSLSKHIEALTMKRD